MFLLVAVRHASAQPDGHQHGVSIQISINFVKTFLRISLIRYISSWRGSAYLPPFISQILDFVYWTVLIFILVYFEWRDTENQQSIWEILVVTWPYARPPARPSTTGGSQGECHFLASVGACNMILHINVVVNWQLSKQGSHWPVSHDHIAGSSIHPSRLRFLLKLSAEGLLVFIWSQAQLQADFFAMGKTHWKKHTMREKTGWFAEKFRTLKEISEPASGRHLFPMSLLSVKQWK